MNNIHEQVIYNQVLLIMHKELLYSEQQKDIDVIINMKKLLNQKVM